MSKIAFLGMGNMGSRMAANLAKSGYDLTVWNRTEEKAQRFAAENGTHAAQTPAEAVAGASIVMTMLADDAALIDAYEASDGILGSLAIGAVAVDMSTVSPETVSRLHGQVGRRKGFFVDAPVSGATAAAAAGTLTIMAAGERNAVESCESILSVMGQPVIYMGDSGTGATMKLAVNSVVHSLNGAISEALALAEKAGIERRNAYQVFLNSAVSAPFVQYRQDAFERPGEVPVAFRLALAAKDLRLALALADNAKASMPQTELNLEVLESAVAADFGDHDESAVAQYLRRV